MNSAQRYESCLSDNASLLISHCVSLRGKSLLLMCGFQTDCLRSRWNMNLATVIQGVRSVKKSISEAESLVTDGDLCLTLESSWWREPSVIVDCLGSVHPVVNFAVLPCLPTDERAGEDAGGETLQSGCWDRLPHQHPGRPGEQLALQAPHCPGMTLDNTQDNP